MMEGERDKLLRMEEQLRKRVVGQGGGAEGGRQRVRCAARVPACRDPNRPIGNFLFLGPTGVGETETMQGTCGVPVHDDERAMVRIDMSEFMERHAVARLTSRRAARLCGLRRRWCADRGGASAASLR